MSAHCATSHTVWGSGQAQKNSFEVRGQGIDELGADGDSGDDTRDQGATASHDHNIERLCAGITNMNARKFARSGTKHRTS